MSVLDQGMGGAADDDLATKCATERRAIVTFDLDFADVRRYPPERHFGIIVLRLVQQDMDHVRLVFANVVEVLATRSPIGQLWVVDERGIRIRGGDAR
jgi:predicted nuclease of predicted toxin-antitoxin system